MYIYVLDKDGKPLMPTEHAGKVRRMLRDGSAVIAGHTPFTVRLTYDTTHYVQPLTAGMDAGTTHVGISVSTDRREYYAAEVELRTDIVEKLSTRREARRTRRCKRSVRYRAPRFYNRRKPEGWLAPSVRQKVASHVKLIEDVTKFLPISEVVVEVAQFDMQKIKNPDIAGAEYQQGPQLDFLNIREYVLWRDGHECQCCHGKSKDRVLNVHHIESRKTGGNSPDNLVTLCETCHDTYHKGKVELKLKRSFRSLRDAAAMNVMRWEVLRQTERALGPSVNVRHTYGYITKNTRIRAGLKKTHAVDALCIAEHPDAARTDEVFSFKQLRRHNRKVMKSNMLTGGRWKRNQTAREVNGYRRYDIVKYERRICYVNSLRTRGTFSLRSFTGEVISNDISYKRLGLIRHSGRSLFYKERGVSTQFPAPAEAGSTLA
jgi:hypothetical protein